MKNRYKTSGIALVCAPAGTILDVLHDSITGGTPMRGRHFTSILKESDAGKAAKFLTAIAARGAAFDWELGVPDGDSMRTLHFAGALTGDKIFIAAADTLSMLAILHVEILNDAAVPASDKSLLTEGSGGAPGHDGNFDEDLFNEISRLNNELVNLQREMAKKNARLLDQEEVLQKNLKEKDLLMKELLHRGKNNMQIIMNLLNLQSMKIDDERIKNAFRDSVERIRSMMMIQEKLYTSGNLASINFSAYITDLAIALFNAYNIDSDRIQLIVRSEGVMIDIDKAVPCGLIINELVTNCLKHAFPDNRKGEIRISLGASPGAGTDGKPRTTYSLRIEDNGTGLPGGFDINATRSLGLRIVYILAGQIDGEITLENNPGAAFLITF